MGDAWQPPADRQPGYRCLTLYRGAWEFAVWQGDRWWVKGYPFTAGVFAPLPELPHQGDM